MVKHVSLYECTICQRRWEDLDKAIACESRGLPQEIVLSTIFSRPTPASGVTKPLQLVGPVVYCLIDAHIDGHVYKHSSIACRDNGHNDTNKGVTCDTGNFLPMGPRNVPDPNWDCFLRMVYSLHSQIDLGVWIGTKTVPLKEFLESREIDDEMDYGFIQT